MIDGLSVRKNCVDVFKAGDKISGVYKIDPDGSGEFEVFCDQATAGGGWTVFQKRQDGSVDFFRRWDDYKRGFGNLNGEFWLGLDKIHRLTVSNRNKLRVDLEDLHGSTAFAEYSSFSLASERVKYLLSLGSYSGMLPLFETITYKCNNKTFSAVTEKSWPVEIGLISLRFPTSWSLCPYNGKVINVV